MGGKASRWRFLRKDGAAVAFCLAALLVLLTIAFPSDSASATSTVARKSEGKVATRPQGAVVPQAKTQMPVGYTISYSPLVSGSADTQTTETVGCPSGTVIWGGGVQTFSFSSLTVTSSFPTGDTGWEGAVSNQDSTDYNDGFYVIAICADQPPDYSIQTSEATANPAGNQTTEEVACPKKTVVLSGGDYSSSSGIDVSLHSSFPMIAARRINYWSVTENNASTTESYLYVYAVCAKKPKGYKLVVGTGVDDPANTSIGSSVNCAKGVAIGGGVLATSTGSTGLDVNVVALYPWDFQSTRYDQFWDGASNFSNEDGGTVQPYAECAI